MQPKPAIFASSRACIARGTGCSNPSPSSGESLRTIGSAAVLREASNQRNWYCSWRISDNRVPRVAASAACGSRVTRLGVLRDREGSWQFTHARSPRQRSIPALFWFPGHGHPRDWEDPALPPSPGYEYLNPRASSARSLRFTRSCYDHLTGRLGVAVDVMVLPYRASC